MGVRLTDGSALCWCEVGCCTAYPHKQQLLLACANRSAFDGRMWSAVSNPSAVFSSSCDMNRATVYQIYNASAIGITMACIQNVRLATFLGTGGIRGRDVRSIGPGTAREVAGGATGTNAMTAARRMLSRIIV